MTVRIPIVSGTVVNELFPSVLSCATFVIVFKKQTNKLGCFFFFLLLFLSHVPFLKPQTTRASQQRWLPFPPALRAGKASLQMMQQGYPFRSQMVLPILPGRWKVNTRVTSRAIFVCLLTLFRWVWFCGGVFLVNTLAFTS